MDHGRAIRDDDVMSTNGEKDRERERAGVMGLSWRESVIVGGLALSLPTMLFGPPVFGYVLDQWLGTTWLVWVFAGIGLLGTAIDVYMILKRAKLLS